MLGLVLATWLAQELLQQGGVLASWYGERMILVARRLDAFANTHDRRGRFSHNVMAPGLTHVNLIVGLTRMYRIPANLDLSPVVGEFTTQVRVGRFDVQFTFGRVNFAVQSPIEVFRDGKLLAHWEEGRWPDSGFYDIMNTEVRRCEAVNDRLIVFEFENGITMHLADSSDQYESMQIAFEGEQSEWII